MKITYGSITINTSANTTGTGPAYLLYLNDFTFIDYCNTVDPVITCTVQVRCASGAITSGDVSVTAPTSNRNIICRSISPAFFQPNIGGNGTVGLNGWYPCSNPAFNPCIASADAIEFQYRKVGVTNWTTYTLSPYLYNAVQISMLSSGDYEYRYKNIDYSTGTTISCAGEYTVIKTVHIN
ncbi:MAG: hypothetical protein JSS70_13645 [Bacteroidetes bacterium]|nr:hypothetical protein [Bacteroidota bacterium]